LARRKRTLYVPGFEKAFSEKYVIQLQLFPEQWEHSIKIIGANSPQVLELITQLSVERRHMVRSGDRGPLGVTVEGN